MSYQRSEAQLHLARQRIPLGAQTFSKTPLHFPCPAPRFVTHGRGGLVYDIDGNEYVDMVGALGTNVLGYCDPDVDAAIRDQLNNGISFSLATDLELQLADLLHRLIPCAEMVRFGKSGTDATSAAVRLARAHTSKNRILFAGYHGWADWSIGPTNPEGIPIGVLAYSVKVPYGDLGALEKELNASAYFAAVVVEPSQPCPAHDLYLAGVQELCRKHECLFIMDEVLTAFRWDVGGAQKMFGVTPDLACLGKGMGNGMPISAIVGRADLLRQINQPGVFYSGTYFGETLSLAAAVACIQKIEREKVCNRLWTIGAQLAMAAEEAIGRNGLGHEVKIRGAAPLLRFEFSSPLLKSMFIENMCKTGTLMAVTMVPGFAHDDNCISRVRKSLDATMKVLADAYKDTAVWLSPGGDPSWSAPQALRS